ncbi:MAG: hypothetical protein ACJ74M_01595 [Gaiellaceae bacterium]
MTIPFLLSVALAVSPARATLLAPASKAVEVRNTGSASLVVDVAAPAAPWLRVRPARIVLRGGARGVLTVRAGLGGRPGDHEVLLLLVARPDGAGRIALRMRVGVRLRVRMPGQLVRHVLVRGLRVRSGRPRRFLLTVANAGNVTEQLRRATVTLVRGGRIVSRLHTRSARELFPGARIVIGLPYAGGARGWVTALVSLRLDGSSVPVQRRYRLRL